MYGQYWMPQVIGNPYLPPVVPTQQVAPPAQNTIQVQQPKPVEQPIVQQTWNWRVVKDYQSMIQESVPFDGTPVLFMMSDSSTFYIVNMVDGKKMVNGYEFSPLDKAEEIQPPVSTPEEKTEQRLLSLENNINLIAEQLGKLLGVKGDESNTQAIESTETTIQRTPIK